MSDYEPPGRPIRGPESWFGEDDDLDQSDLSLPHWTQPGTDSQDPIDSAPRWRGGPGDYNELDDIRLLDPTPPQGGDGSAESLFFGFDDDEFSEASADVPAADFARGGPSEHGSEREPAQSSGGSDRDLILATATGVGLAAVSLAALWLGPLPALVVIAVLIGLATLEFYNAMRKVGYSPASLVGLVSSVGLTAGAYWKGVLAYPVVLGLAVVFCLLWYMLLATADRPVPNLGVTMLGIGYVGVLGSFAGLLLSSTSVVTNDLTGIEETVSHGTGLVFAAILATVVYDVGAYVSGRSIGRTSFSVHSPNKTLEGVLGGTVLCIIVTVVVIAGFQVAPWGANPGGVLEAVILGAVAAGAATLGDLSESMIKRDLGLKDMGTVLPGHGGLLDRFDGLLFVMAATWCAALATGVIESIPAATI